MNLTRRQFNMGTVGLGATGAVTLAGIPLSAPERRVFKIDVGEMPPHFAMTFIERAKNEFKQKRFPSLSGGNSNVMDS